MHPRRPRLRYVAVSALSMLGLLQPGCAQMTTEPGAKGEGSAGTAPIDARPAEVCAASKVGPPLLRRPTRDEFEASVQDIFGIPTTWHSSLPADPASKVGFTTDASLLVVNAPLAREYLRAAETIGELAAADLANSLACSTTHADRACAEEGIARWSKRIFRRPATADEAKRFADHFDSIAKESDFKTGIKWLVVALLQSPQFLYRSEVGTSKGNERHLDDFEIGTELSYMYTGSAPDDELLTLAADGKLTDAAVRRAQAVRLLEKSPRRLDVTRRFFREWLGYQVILGQTRVDVPNFAADISPRLVGETQTFLDQIVFGDKGTIHDLLTADFTTLDATLSQYYGFGNVMGATFERVTRPAGKGRGILAQGAVLAATAHQSESSPVRRGLLFTEKFLCMPRPAPPDVVPTLEATTSAVDAEHMTTRQKYEMIHSTGACGACHQMFEPFGYPFEQFDETGRFRDTENGLPVDALAGGLKLPSGQLVDVDGLDELAGLVQTSSEIQNCFSGLLTTYLFSGAGGTNCIAEEARRALASGELSVYDYLVEMSQSEQFVKRQR